MAKDAAALAVVRGFGEFVSDARAARHLTQEELAERADLDRTTVSKIERGTGNPRLLTINKLAIALDESFAGFLPFRPIRGRK